MLKDENENLDKRVMALEIECAALADRLIQVGVVNDIALVFISTYDRAK